MECGWCLDYPPDAANLDSSDSDTDIYCLWLTFGPRQTQGWKLVDKKRGFTVIQHWCVDSDGWKFKITGDWPKTRGDADGLYAFIEWTWETGERLEARGPKPAVTIDAIFECLRRLPPAARWPLIASELETSVRTLQHMIKQAGFNSLAAAKKHAMKK
jgi:hypothetical protein